MTEPSQKYRDGMEVRRAVLGNEYVDAAMSRRNDFNSALQDLVTEYCWGEIWTRPTLDRKTRSMINIGMLVALNRPHELRAHVRGALRNGCTVEEISEVLLQTTIYVGVPAGVDGFRIAGEALAEAEAELLDQDRDADPGNRDASDT